MRWWPLFFVLGACATQRGEQVQAVGGSEPEEWAAWPDPAAPAFPPSAEGVEAARVAARLVGLASVHQGGPAAKKFPDDCTGVVRYAWSALGVDLYEGFSFGGENGVTAMHGAALDRGALHLGTPAPGDLIFFRETYDRNRNGLIDDGLTHVGIVESVDGEGTVTFIHRGGKGVQRAAMNLNAPTQHLDSNHRVLNDYVRPASRLSPARLTSELFVDYATPGRSVAGLRSQAQP